jgi:hypothetical protein
MKNEANSFEEKLSALFSTFVDSRQQRILYFSGSMHACRNRRVGLYIKGVSQGFVQMVYYCLDLFLISLQKSALVRWTLTKHFIASLSSAINDRAGITCTSNTSHEK